MVLKLILISALILVVALIAMGVRIIAGKDGRFPETHAGRNPEMQKRGVTCAKNTDIGCSQANKSECLCSKND